MNTVCEVNKCNGCMVCKSICPQKCISIEESVDVLNATIDTSKCISCHACEKVCPNIVFVEKKKPIEWYQGWAIGYESPSSSSGGIASAIIRSFIESGGYVAACLFKKGRFVFEITNDIEIARQFAGSKYVKSNPLGIYEKIKEKLKTNRVLFIGLPCQVAAVKNYIKDKEKLYTIDLICHGTPSVKLLEYYLKERGFDIYSVKNILFRHGTNMGIWLDNKKIDKPRVIDEYLCAFLEGIDYTENCYSCKYASFSRVSDLTLGDSWGSEITNREELGISLVLVQTEYGKKLLSTSESYLTSVDINKAIKNNHQLVQPTEKNIKHDIFFKYVMNGNGFKKATFYSLPYLMFKQWMKKIIF